jgi:hypothetical protein
MYHQNILVQRHNEANTSAPLSLAVFKNALPSFTNASQKVNLFEVPCSSCLPVTFEFIAFLTGQILQYLDR